MMLNVNEGTSSRAADAGFSHFDTSPYYGFGLSEVDVGQLLKHRGHELTVATKVGLYPPQNSRIKPISVWLRKLGGKLSPKISRPVVDWSLNAAELRLNRSLHTFNRDWVDFLFLHEPVPGVFNADEWHFWLEQKKEQRKIRAWGLAGPAAPMATWLHRQHPIANVMQVRDSLVNKEADVVMAAGRELRSTYGYLSQPINNTYEQSVDEILCSASARNSTGSIVISTRRIERLRQISVAA